MFLLLQLFESFYSSEAPDLAKVQLHTTLHVKPAGMSHHIAIPTSSAVLVGSTDLPWARIEQILSTSDQRLWVFLRFLSIEDAQNPLCQQTGVPVVVDKMDLASTALLPANSILGPIRLIPIPERSSDVGLSVHPYQRMWVNWWIAAGNHYYDEDQRFAFLEKHQLIDLET